MSSTNLSSHIDQAAMMAKVELVAELFPGPEFRLAQSIADVKIQSVVEIIFETCVGDIVAFSPDQNWPGYQAKVTKKGIDSRFEILPSRDQKNYGIFAKTNIKKGSPIGFYAGEYKIIGLDEDDTYDNSYAFDVSDNIELDQEEVAILKNSDYPINNNFVVVKIDASERGNFTRFIQHSSTETNVDTECVKRADGMIEVLFMARDEIKAGQELFLDYGDEYLKKTTS